MGLLLKWRANRNRAARPVESIEIELPEPEPIQAEPAAAVTQFELTDSERYRIQAQAMTEAAEEASGRKEADSFRKLARAWRRLANEAAELEAGALRPTRRGGRA